MANHGLREYPPTTMMAEEVKNLVNSWVEKETRGLIKNILDSVDKSTKLIIANALYFREWISHFNAFHTEHYDFHIFYSSSIQVPFMTSKKKQYISVFDGFKVLMLYASWPLFVSQIIHESFVEVDEKGTEAAAVTVAVMAFGCCMSPKIEVAIDFVADLPFLFVIRENTTGMVQFIGQVLNPSANS